MKVIKTERELLGVLRSMREQTEAQPPAAADPAAAAAPAASAAPAPGAPAAPAQPITVEDIIDKLNIVRSGRSTKDSDVKRELEEYVAQFSEDEKQALIAFLEGLGQILTSGVDSDDAADPQDPYALQIQKSGGATASNAVRPPQPAAAAPAAPAPGPVPIKIGG
jgi:pyruvate dehydrogenase E2 component (dihydrolipoamide acetyltransferase)